MRIRTSGLRGSVAFWALAGLALFVSHDAIFLLQTGPGESLTTALRSAGHDYWATASVALVVIGLIAAAGIGLRLRRLRRHAVDLGASPIASNGYRRRALGSWGRLFVIVALAFVVQESAEHFATHGHAIGIGALVGPEYPLALPVIAAITGLGALMAALIVGVEHGLVASIAAALARRPVRPARTARRVPASAAPPRPSILSRPGASRAPPPLLVT